MVDVALLLNPSARSGKAAALRARVLAAFGAARVDVDVFEVAGEGLRARACELVELGYATIVAAGGDGTTNAVAAALAGTRSALGVLPLGTVNHFARRMGVPLELDAAVALLRDGAPAPVAIGDVGGHMFVNNVTLGLYPLVVRAREAIRARVRIHKWAAQALAAARVLPRAEPLELTVRAGAIERSYRTPFVFVGHDGHLGAVDLGAPRAPRGELCVGVALPRGGAGLVALPVRALLGRHAPRDFEWLRGPEVAITSAREKLFVALDGEVREVAGPFHFRVRPGGLRVVLPRGKS